MKRLFTYSASLTLLLAVSPSYGEYWEEHPSVEAVMTEQGMGGTNPVGLNPGMVENDRRMQLERGLYQEFDIESLPPTAAGSPETDASVRPASMDWDAVEDTRRMQLERGFYH
ncbi:hypothetical protein LPB19_08515 [Marinobacter salinisoli]|uniref:Uncharacterized protein n=1 Tax=Marinobacter salinisoli TaxID=2769486 RepID=A0ABX7MVQ4_9GAMM|nr:hypothetical protein [Marinobacter salinisoli]QSP96399.1 hypothetical protein LPB19_08515 [Marinobacter salinisoli]